MATATATVYNFEAICAQVFPEQSANQRANNPAPTREQVITELSSLTQSERFARPAHNRAFGYLYNAGVIVRQTPFGVGCYANVWYTCAPFALRFLTDLQSQQARERIEKRRNTCTAMVVITPQARNLARYLERRYQRPREQVQRAMDHMYSVHMQDGMMSRYGSMWL